MREQHRQEDPIREKTIIALGDLIEPLLELMFDVGITVSEFNKTVRARAAQAATKRVIRTTGRSSKSRVAVLTGLPRSEIAKILKAPHAKNNKSQNVLRRVLDVWFEDRKFSAKDGTPDVLPIFGNRLSFQTLVEKYGNGIPIRAVLDELIEIGAIELLPNQRIRANSRIGEMNDLTPQSISAFGERARDLLQTLVHNMRHRGDPRFEATTSVILSDAAEALRMTNVIAMQIQSFIDESDTVLKREKRQRLDSVRSSGTYRVGVTAYCFEQRLQSGTESLDGTNLKIRKNLRRKK